VLWFMDEFFVHGMFQKGWNASFLALIPKVNDSQNLNEYGHISLIGSILKIPFLWNSSKNLRKSGFNVFQKCLINLKFSQSSPGLLSLPHSQTTAFILSS